MSGAAKILKSQGIRLAKTHFDWNAPVIFRSTAADLSKSIGATYNYNLNLFDPIGVFTTYNPFQTATYGSIGTVTFATFHSTKYYRN